MIKEATLCVKMVVSSLKVYDRAVLENDQDFFSSGWQGSLTCRWLEVLITSMDYAKSNDTVEV